jgi:hypothetical protein
VAGAVAGAMLVGSSVDGRPHIILMAVTDNHRSVHRVCYGCFEAGRPRTTSCPQPARSRRAPD